MRVSTLLVSRIWSAKFNRGLFRLVSSSGGGGSSQVAKDALGNDVTLESWTKTHQPGDHSLTQGLKGDPTYLIVTEEGGLVSYGLNAVCTHLGCVVPWVSVSHSCKNNCIPNGPLRPPWACV